MSVSRVGSGDGTRDGLGSRVDGTREPPTLNENRDKGDEDEVETRL